MSRFGSRSRTLGSLHRLAEAAERLEAGDLSARVPESGPEEGMGRLEHAFNDMAAALERRWREAGDDQRGTQELVALLGREIRASLSSTVAYMDTLLADARGIEALDSDARFRALEAGRESAAQALDLINRRLLDPREPVD